MNSEINLLKFNIENINSTNSCSVIGSKNSGKTVLLKDIMSYQNIKSGLAISEIESLNFKYPTQKYSDELIDNLIYNQKHNILEKLPNSNMFLIFDNINLNKKMQDLFFNNRHYKIMLLIESQVPLKPLFRANIDFSFIFKSEPDQYKILYEKYFSCFKTFEIFEKVFNKLESHECLVIDNTTNSNKIQDQVFWYKANLHSETNQR